MALEELGGREDSCAYDGPRHRRCAGRIRQLLIDKKRLGIDLKMMMMMKVVMMVAMMDKIRGWIWTGCSTPTSQPK